MSKSLDFSPIKRIKLKEAFIDIDKFKIISNDEDYFNELFEITNRGSIFILDDEAEGHTIFIEDTNGLGSDKIFKIVNSKHTWLFLWHIDGVLFKKDSKCDCAIIADNYLGFVEFKSNATNKTQEAIKENYNKAIDQLKHTIIEVKERCNKVGIDLIKETFIEAFAVFNKTVPRNNASQKNLAAKFQLEMYNIPLRFSNEKIM